MEEGEGTTNSSPNVNETNENDEYASDEESNQTDNDIVVNDLSSQEAKRRKELMARELGFNSDDEAEEGDPDEEAERRLFEDDEEDEGEDLFGDNMMKDYELNEEDNYYDPELLDDDEDIEPLTLEQRRAAEIEMEEREQRERGDEDAKIGMFRDAGILYEDDLEAADNYESIYDDPNMMRWDGEDDELETGDDDDISGDLASHLGKDKKETLANQEFRKLYAKTFKYFLEEFEMGGSRIYYQKIEHAAQANKHSILIDYSHLTAFNPILSLYLTDVPEETLGIMNEVLHKKVKELYPNFDNIHREWFVRFYGLSVSDNLRDLRHTHLNILISVRGVITRRTSVFPQLKIVKFDCGRCGGLVGPIILNGGGSKIPKPSSCPSCQSKGPFSINQTQTVYQNYQKITLQESPGSVSAGRIPRSKDVILLNDLIDCARPGDEIEVTGVYKHSYNAMLNVRQGFPVFSTVIEANSVRKLQDKVELEMLSETEKKYLDQLKKCKRLQKKIINSVAPSIFGHEDIKLAIALSMIGASQKQAGSKHSVRGDINILLVGDPGTAKSQFLKYIEKTARRAVYTTGKGSTAVGLTASVRKDPVTNEWTLEGGALVLADRGVCLIDEFDKMNDQDRTSIHEAMEQQTISISKAGIVTTLQARCAVVAAANPVRGKYDASRTFRENVDLTDPILSRFDVLSVVKDIVDPAMDEILARFVVESHANSHPTARRKKQLDKQNQEAEIRPIIKEEKEQWFEDNELPIPQDFFKKYISRAKEINVQLDKLDTNRLKNFYTDLRADSKMGGGVQIGVRHLESMIRMAEANARLHLRDRVIDEDVSTAIRLMLESYISTQKYAVSRSLRKKYQSYLKSPKDNNQIILHLLNQIVTELVDKETDDDEETTLSIDVQLLADRARTFDMHSIDAFLQDEKLLETNCLSYDPERNVLIKTFFQ